MFNPVAGRGSCAQTMPTVQGNADARRTNHDRKGTLDDKPDESKSPYTDLSYYFWRSLVNFYTHIQTWWPMLTVMLTCELPAEELLVIVFTIFT